MSFVTFTRYFAAGGFTIIAVPWFENLGVHWTLTILGCISAIMAPVPFGKPGISDLYQMMDLTADDNLQCFTILDTRSERRASMLSTKSDERSAPMVEDADLYS